MSFVIVDMNMTEEDRMYFNYPDEWEAYVVKWNEKTVFLDELGNEIQEGQFEQHDYHIKIWTKEKFKQKITELRNDEKLDEIYPTYTARQIQLIEMTWEDYVLRKVSNKEGELSVQVFFGEEISNDNKKLYEFQKELNETFEKRNDIINRHSFMMGKGNKRDTQFLEIEEYPAFIVFDHEKMIFKTYDKEEYVEFIINY